MRTEKNVRVAGWFQGPRKQAVGQEELEVYLVGSQSAWVMRSWPAGWENLLLPVPHLLF